MQAGYVCCVPVYPGLLPELLTSPPPQAYSAILTAANDVFIWWKPDQSVVDVAASSAGEDAPGFDPTTEGVTFPLQVNSLRLPDVPDEADTPDWIRRVACGDEFVVALSDAGKVFYLDISLTPATRNRDGEAAAISELEHNLLAARRQWAYLDEFSSARLSQGQATGQEAIPSEVKITHVSAQFKTFAACKSAFHRLWLIGAQHSYIIPTPDSVPPTATNEGSIVMLGEKGETRPVIIPELQNIGVIQYASFRSSRHAKAHGELTFL